jgi:hypothetical protein
VPAAFADTGDVAITSVTPNVTHVHVGKTVTFAVTERFYSFTALPGAKTASVTPCVADESIIDTNLNNNSLTSSVRVIGNVR